MATRDNATREQWLILLGAGLASESVRNELKPVVSECPFYDIKAWLHAVVTDNRTASAECCRQFAGRRENNETSIQTLTRSVKNAAAKQSGLVAIRELEAAIRSGMDVDDIRKRIEGLEANFGEKGK